MLEYLEPFNCVQTVVILVCKQISLDSLKNNITYKLIYKSCITIYVQTNELWLI